MFSPILRNILHGILTISLLRNKLLEQWISAALDFPQFFKSLIPLTQIHIWSMNRPVAKIQVNGSNRYQQRGHPLPTVGVGFCAPFLPNQSGRTSQQILPDKTLSQTQDSIIYHVAFTTLTRRPAKHWKNIMRTSSQLQDSYLTCAVLG